MKTRTILNLLFVASLVAPAACGVKDPIFNTPHPGHGMVTLTTDWSGIGQGLTAPGSYTVKATLNGTAATTATDAYSATLTGVTNKLDHLFAPGTYRFYVYNTPEGMSVSGTTATVEQAAVTPAEGGTTPVTAYTTPNPAYTPAPTKAAGPLIRSNPGWLFTSTLEATLKADSEQALTARMQQQVRQLTLIVEPTGGTTGQIETITATLSGVAGSLDFASGVHGTPSAVPLTFTRITQGEDAGKWTVTVRLLGIAGEEQLLAGTITFSGGNPAPMPLGSDLSKALAGFNADKHQPLTLDGVVADTPSETGVTATITGWIPGGGGHVSAE